MKKEYFSPQMKAITIRKVVLLADSEGVESGGRGLRYGGVADDDIEPE